MSLTPAPVTDVDGARILGLFLDSITTDHISPAGGIRKDSPAGRYLIEHGVAPHDFNSYGSRRGNHEVMMRGTFANTRIKNQMVPGVEGGVTVHYPSGETLPIYDAAMRYASEGVPLVVFAGKEYGTGSSRDWAAKGTTLLGVRAVIAERFAEGMSWQALELKGDETVSLKGLADLKPMQWLEADIAYANGATRTVRLRAAIDTFDELDYFRNGGILHYVLRSLARDAA
jgi:aconitate hydratase